MKKYIFSEKIYEEIYFLRENLYRKMHPQRRLWSCCCGSWANMFTTCGNPLNKIRGIYIVYNVKGIYNTWDKHTPAGPAGTGSGGPGPNLPGPRVQLPAPAGYVTYIMLWRFLYVYKYFSRHSNLKSNDFTSLIQQVSEKAAPMLPASGTIGYTHTTPLRWPNASLLETKWNWDISF